mgnify:CR=1 FL=1
MNRKVIRIPLLTAANLLMLICNIQMRAQNRSHFATEIMLAMPTGEYRNVDNRDRAEPGFGFDLAYFAPIGNSGLGLNSSFTGIFNKNVRFKSTNRRFFKVTGGWYSHLMLSTGPAYVKYFKNFGLKLYTQAGLNFTGISDSEETILQTGQIIETHDFEPASFFFYKAGISFILEEKVLLGLSYMDLGQLEYQSVYDTVNDEPVNELTSFRGYSINVKLGILL